MARVDTAASITWPGLILTAALFFIVMCGFIFICVAFCPLATCMSDVSNTHSARVLHLRMLPRSAPNTPTNSANALEASGSTTAQAPGYVCCVQVRKALGTLLCQVYTVMCSSPCHRVPLSTRLFKSLHCSNGGRCLCSVTTY